jgi:hypothetical protein
MARLNTTTDVLTLAQARERLALVRPLVERLMHLTEQLRQLATDENSTPSPTAEAKRWALEESFKSTLRELNAQGAVLKDPMSGLIDFYTWRDDDFAFLCWKHGEADIHWWHGLHEGFQGRRPITEHEANS